MVLGFGSKSKKKTEADMSLSEHGLRQSPSLPQMTAQGVSWPSNLVDEASIKESPPPQSPPASHPNTAGATKVSFQFNENGQAAPIPFHRPFRLSQSNRDRASAVGKGDVKAGSIAALYMSQHPPTAFGQKPHERSATPQSATTARTVRRSHSQRKRVAPTFNLMVVGAQGTGKVSLDCSSLRVNANLESIDVFVATFH